MISTICRIAIQFYNLKWSMIMVAKKVFAINNYLYTYFICIYVYLYPHFTNRTMSSTWRILVNIWVNINMRTNRIFSPLLFFFLTIFNFIHLSAQMKCGKQVLIIFLPLMSSEEPQTELSPRIRTPLPPPHTPPPRLPPFPFLTSPLFLSFFFSLKTRLMHPGWPLTLMQPRMTFRLSCLHFSSLGITVGYYFAKIEFMCYWAQNPGLPACQLGTPAT